jgi:hypothetical protein
MLDNMKKMLYDLYVNYYESEEGTAKEQRADGAILAIKRLLRSEYGREKANEIIKEQSKNAKYIVFGDENFQL